MVNFGNEDTRRTRPRLYSRDTTDHHCIVVCSGHAHIRKLQDIPDPSFCFSDPPHATRDLTDAGVNIALCKGGNEGGGG